MQKILFKNVVFYYLMTLLNYNRFVKLINFKIYQGVKQSQTQRNVFHRTLSSAKIGQSVCPWQEKKIIQGIVGQYDQEPSLPIQRFIQQYSSSYRQGLCSKPQCLLFLYNNSLHCVSFYILFKWSILGCFVLGHFISLLFCLCQDRR